MAENTTDPERENAVRIVAVFSVLIHSWLNNKFSEAAEAREELAALGVKVTIPPRRSRKGGNDGK